MQSEGQVIAMPEPVAQDAATFARRHAGEHDASLTPEQRDLLGRVIAKRVERGAKLEMIARAVAHALPALGAERALRLGRDEALRALAWEGLARLRAQGDTEVALSPAADACPACWAVAGSYALADAPRIPVPGCTHAGGCRCLYRSVTAAAPTAAHAELSAAASGTPPQPWYRPRPPRPHGPRWAADPEAGGRLPAPSRGRQRGTHRPERSES
jgi:hypothetical protein